VEQILILKVGTTLPTLRSRRGDFEHWILTGLQVHVARTRILDVRNGSALPDYEGISGVVITGSHDRVTDHQKWSERTAEWLSGAVERRIPILGICYGHQLLAYALGGQVADNPDGLEFGTVEVHLNENARDDPLFGGLPTPVRAHVSHSQSVLELPAGARLLASSALDPHQAFVVGKSAWGVQFHPEFDTGIVVEYIRSFRDDLLAGNQDPDHLMATCVETPRSRGILKRFAQAVDKAPASFA
jgi:GMP synthase (glutamine-hydrolysing)